MSPWINDCPSLLLLSGVLTEVEEGTGEVMGNEGRETDEVWHDDG